MSFKLRNQLIQNCSKDDWHAACVAYSNDGIASSQRAPDEFEAEVASLSPTDPVAKCLSSRMLSLLGNVQHEGTEVSRDQSCFCTTFYQDNV